ncbi:hypothetical protein H6764_01690 [Candidatus Nomurabacteria bacterium]|nr:hypothetical protein [Candidatus Nomurabacteria bacterium]
MNENKNKTVKGGSPAEASAKKTVRKKERTNDSSESPDVMKESDLNDQILCKKQSNWGYGRYSFAVLLIVFGFILLLNNVGLLPWEIWDQVWKLWPIAWIVLGLHWILGKSLWTKILVTLITIAFTGYVIVIAFAHLSLKSGTNFISSVVDKLPAGLVQLKEDLIANESTILTTDDYDISLLDKVSLDLDVNSGELTLADGSESRNILQLDSKYYKHRTVPDIKDRLVGSTLDFSLKSQNKNAFNFSINQIPQYDLLLGQTEIPYGIYLNINSGSAEIDLEKVLLDEFNADISSGSLNAKFGSNSIPSSFNVEVGSGSSLIDLTDIDMSLDKLDISVRSGTVRVYLPSDAGYQINYDIGSGIMKADSKSFLDTGTYTSKNYQKADVSINLTIRVRSGLAVIEQ